MIKSLWYSYDFNIITDQKKIYKLKPPKRYNVTSIIIGKQLKSDNTEIGRNYGKNYAYSWFMELYTSKTTLKNNLYLSGK